MNMYVYVYIYRRDCPHSSRGIFRYLYVCICIYMYICIYIDVIARKVPGELLGLFSCMCVYIYFFSFIYVGMYICKIYLYI
jgi:hypothetical protein